MVSRSRGQLLTLNVEDNVAVYASECDRGCGDPADVIALIFKGKNERYCIGAMVSDVVSFILHIYLRRVPFS